MFLLPGVSGVPVVLGVLVFIFHNSFNNRGGNNSSLILLCSAVFGFGSNLHYVSQTSHLMEDNADLVLGP